MRKESVNPDMELSQSKSTPQAVLDEKKPAKMPQVGIMPTGMKAAKKNMPE